MSTQARPPSPASDRRKRRLSPVPDQAPHSDSVAKSPLSASAPAPQSREDGGEPLSDVPALVPPARQQAQTSAPPVGHGENTPSYHFRPVAPARRDRPSRDAVADLSMARGAYWNRDLAGAIREYRRLARQYPDNADVFGELGNVYVEMGDAKAAIEAYSRAVAVLMKKGEEGRARALIKAIEGLESGVISHSGQHLPRR